MVMTDNLQGVRDRLERVLSPESLAHALRTAALARELATLHGVDPDRAELVGLLHDVGDQYSDKQLLSLAEQYGIPLDLTEARIPRLLHAAVGAEVLRREWGVTDDELLDAVDVHVTGSSIMSPLAKVLFLADKLEPYRDRHYGGLDPIRALARSDLDAAVLKLYAWRVSELVDDGRPVDDKLIRARNVLIERMVAARR